MRFESDTLIIGGGIVGAACARVLQMSGQKVTVLESRYPGTGATSACMGHIVVMDDSEAQMQLSSFSRKEWEKLAPILPKDCEDQRIGTLWVAADAEEMEAAESKSRYYTSWNIATEILDAQALYRLEPYLGPGLVGALFVPGDRAVYAARCAEWFLRDVNVRVSTKAVKLGDREVYTENGDIFKAKFIVLAGGAESVSLIPDLPIEPRKGHLCITERYPDFCHHQIVELGYLKSAHQFSSESVAFNVQPRPNGQILIGSSREFSGWNPDINGPLLGKMLARSRHYMPDIQALQILRTWVGFRPATRDKLPLIGAWPKHEGLYIAAGHEGLGITTCLGTAHLLAAELLGLAPPFDPTPFKAERIIGDKHE